MIAEFAKEKVFWTRKMNLKLVKFMEKRPNIWNPKHPKYTSVEHRDQTYSEFASKYGNEFTGQAVKDRWTNIRSTFANYLRKQKASQAKGDGEACKITWHLWDACSFLLKVNKNISKNIQIDRNVSGDDIKEDIIIENKEELSSEEDVSERRPFEIDTTCENIANGILNVFRGVQNDVFGIENTKYGQIGRLVATKLSQMSSYDAAKLSSKIIDILLVYHEDSPLNPNIVKAECH